MKTSKPSGTGSALAVLISSVGRRKYSLHELLAMQGNAPLLIDSEWDFMPASGLEVDL